MSIAEIMINYDAYGRTSNVKETDLEFFSPNISGENFRQFILPEM